MDRIASRTMNHWDNLDRLPGPLCRLIGNYRNEQVAYPKVVRLRDCFEWVIKWHTATTLSYILEHELMDSARAAGLRTLLANKLRSPSLGVWVEFFRDGKKYLQSDLPPWLEGGC